MSSPTFCAVFPDFEGGAHFCGHHRLHVCFGFREVVNHFPNHYELTRKAITPLETALLGCFRVFGVGVLWDTGETSPKGHELRQTLVKAGISFSSGSDTAAVRFQHSQVKPKASATCLAIPTGPDGPEHQALPPRARAPGRCFWGKRDMWPDIKGFTVVY